MPQPPQNFTRDNQQPYHQIQQNQPQQQMGGGYGPGPPMPPTNIPSMMNPQMGQPPFRGGEGLIPQQFPSTTADQQPPPVINGFVQQHPLGGMGARGGQQDINGLSSQFSQMQPPSGF